MNDSFRKPAEIIPRSGVEQRSLPDRDRSNETGWPDLRPAERCDGENPMTGQPCAKGHHRGHHRDTSGAQWLDD
ncbi:hypothetical protein ACI2LF_04495 [Kribbella sp. NPDC020789]